MTEAFTSIPKPSTPEFTAKYIDSSYDIPTSSSIDPYTGQTITTQAQHVDNRTIEVKVKNQPFTSYVDDKSNFTIELYYTIRVRGHFGGNWTEVFSVDNAHPVQSNSDYTTISLPLGGNIGPFASLPTNSSSQIDIQVEAMTGYFSRTVGFASWYFTGEESGWSSAQTLTIGETAQTSTPGASQLSTSPSVNPTVSQAFGLDLVGIAVVILFAVIIVLLVFVVIYLRKRGVSGSVKKPPV
ncbi:MAG: hypothetical protein M1540_02430 [Candidatus Bathyarchaeota archaeon]|nr:hypothetical protein [Candidatus Bathyarchaeota archaeon]